MQLTEKHLEEYRERGFLFFEGLLSKEEMDSLEREIPGVVAQKRREIVYETDKKTVRSIFNLHAYNERYARLVRHPRLVEPAMQLVGGPVYVFQIVLNHKAPFTGEQWPWHQDYPTYHSDDGMPSPRVVNVLIFQEEVNEFNGPLMLIPGSHKIDFPLPDINTKDTSYPGRYLSTPHVTEVALRNGIVAPKGPAGTVIFAHTNIVHGSAPNMSPWGRALISLTLNSVENAITVSRRPDYIVPRDLTPITPLSDDCLLVA